MRIIGPPSATPEVVRGGAINAGADPRFAAQMFDPLWIAATVLGIDPVGVVAQAFKETAGGRFGGAVTAQHHNTCGLKVRYLGYGGPATDGDQQLAHAAFASWEVGAVAHVQHLRAYAGWPLEQGLIVDPRYLLVVGRYRLETFEELGGKWAPSPTYGLELVALARRLVGVTA